MAIIFTDGFDQYSATSEIYRRWTSNIQDIASLQTGRFGGKCIRFATGSHGIQICPNGVDNATLMCGFAFRTTSYSAGNTLLCSFRDGSQVAGLQVGVAFDSSGHLRVFRLNTATILATGTTVLSLNTWYYIEFKATIHNTAGAFTLKIDGATELNLSSQNTRATTNNYANIVGLDAGSSSSNDFDDFYISDTSGSAPQNDLLGAVQIQWVTPSADTTQKDFTPNSGLNNFSRVNEAVADITTYVSGSAAGKDLYAMTGALTTEPTTIFGIKTSVLAQSMSAGARTIRGICKSGATLQNGASHSINTDPVYLDDILPLNPNTGLAWTATPINSLQLGEEIVS